MYIRPRRNRSSSAVRSLVRENTLSVTDLILPLFVVEGTGVKSEISAMPGVYRYSIDLLTDVCKHAHTLGIVAVALFPAVDDSLKDSRASVSADDNGLYPRAIRAIKQALPDLLVIGDVAMDPYSSDGHDGLVSDTGEILNDESLPILADMALAQARAGADVVAPSDMMDGRIGYLRSALDRAGFHHVSILAYTAKYASAFYGPFRCALESAPKKGDKKSYQMDPSNSREALRELELDIDEGADIVMVKPGLPYLDVIRQFKEFSTVPVAAYNVSGEYAMIKMASDRGALDYRASVMELLTCFKRAGADMILTYHALEVAEWMDVRTSRASSP